MPTLTYQSRRSELLEYFDRTAADAWRRLTSDAPVSRIRATVPDVKLIAVLREPIARAQSHHRMVVHRGRESRSFEEAARAFIASMQNSMC